MEEKSLKNFLEIYINRIFFVINLCVQSGVARVINLDYLVAGHHIVAQNFSLRYLM